MGRAWGSGSVLSYHELGHSQLPWGVWGWEGKLLTSPAPRGCKREGPESSKPKRFGVLGPPAQGI